MNSAYPISCTIDSEQGHYQAPGSSSSCREADDHEDDDRGPDQRAEVLPVGGEGLETTSPIRFVGAGDAPRFRSYAPWSDGISALAQARRDGYGLDRGPDRRLRRDEDRARYRVRLLAVPHDVHAQRLLALRGAQRETEPDEPQQEQGDDERASTW